MAGNVSYQVADCQREIHGLWNFQRQMTIDI